GIAGSKTKIYLIPHSKRLRAVTPETILTDGGLPLDIGTAVKSYHRKDLILDCDLTQKEALASLVWLDFAAGDQKRLEKYVERAFRFGKDKFGYDKMMGIFVPEDNVEQAVSLDGSDYEFQAIYCNLYYHRHVRFVGVRG
ncbi:MAG: hypothetical protein AABX05_03910, partial [Nanoarchaeota archaeon]